MTDKDDEFQRDPLRFAKSYTIQPMDFQNKNPNLPERAAQMDKFRIFDMPKYDAGGALDGVLGVSGGMLVAYTTLEKDSRPNIQNTYVLNFKTKKWGVADMFPVWFLPWASNNVTRMRIPSSDELLRRGRATGKKMVDPDIFFTAAINGCSVFVTGDPTSPTVWHGGTEQARSSPKNNSQVPSFQGLDSAMHWRRIVAQASGGRPGAEVNKGHYTNYQNTDHTHESMAYMQFLKNNQQKTLRIDTVVPMGSIFGVRTAGRWAFYLQKTVEFTITRLTKEKRLFKSTKYVDSRGDTGKNAWDRNNSDPMPVASASTRVVRLPVQVTQFYPGGGRSPDSAKVEPVMVKSILEQYA
jgi:hypothetical protein